jgi:hypothetical protein
MGFCLMSLVAYLTLTMVVISSVHKGAWCFSRENSRISFFYLLWWLGIVISLLFAYEI